MTEERCHYCGEKSPFRLYECHSKNCDIRKIDNKIKQHESIVNKNQ